MFFKTVKKLSKILRLYLDWYFTWSLGLAKAIKGEDATNFARDREFRKLSDDEKDNLVNSRKMMLVIREPLQSQDFELNVYQ